MPLNTSQGDCHTVFARLSLFLLLGFPSRLRPVLPSPPASVFRVQNTFFFLVGCCIFLKVGFGELCFLYHVGENLVTRDLTRELCPGKGIA